MLSRPAMEAEIQSIATDVPMIAKANVTTMRNLRLLIPSPFFRCQYVPNAADIAKQRPSFPLEFLAQMAQMHIDGRTLIGAIFPLIEDSRDLVSGDRACRRAHQQLENLKLDLGQNDGFTRPRDDSCGRI